MVQQDNWSVMKWKEAAMA